MSNTEKAKYVFTVKEGQPSENGANDAPVWIMLEPSTKSLKVTASGFLSLRLNPNATIDEAQKIARFLNDNIAEVGFTS